MKRIDLKPGNMLYPLPVVLVSCGIESKEHNIITIAWVGTINSNPPMLSISVRPERYSYEIISKTKEFVVNIPTYKMANEVDFCGVKSGRKVNKFKHCGFDIKDSVSVKTPSILQCPVSIECIVKNEIVLGSHTMFIAEVVAVTTWESNLNKSTQAIDINKVGLLSYSHGGYYKLGEYINHFGFSVKKK